jgi:hypothetical protein
VAAIVIFSPPFYSGGERARQRERQPADQTASRRLQRKRRQGVVEVRLAEAGDSQSRRDGIGSQPDETELIASSEQNHGGSGSRDVRKGKSELNGRMRGLTRLGARGEVSASNEKKPTRRGVLEMRHISIIATGASRRYALERTSAHAAMTIFRSSPLSEPKWTICAAPNRIVETRSARPDSFRALQQDSRSR